MKNKPRLSPSLFSPGSSSKGRIAFNYNQRSGAAFRIINAADIKKSREGEPQQPAQAIHLSMHVYGVCNMKGVGISSKIARGECFIITSHQPEVEREQSCCSFCDARAHTHTHAATQPQFLAAWCIPARKMNVAVPRWHRNSRQFKY
jgi:hypothetical protein